ncbi:MAG: 30S ribosomal protein S20 [Planctomycetota bacterium]
MAHSVSAKKRIRQNVTHRARNRWRLRTMRTAIKAFQQSLAAGDMGEAKTTFQKACAVIDRTAQKGVIHRKQADRRKRRLSAAFKAGSQTAA